MNPNEFGKKLGIGLRVAGKIAQQRVQDSGSAHVTPPASVSGVKASASANPASASTRSAGSYVAPDSGQTPIPQSAPRPAPAFVTPQRVQQAAARSHNLTRAAGRGLGGFLRPFGRIGGLLWLEVTGFFFGLFAIWFISDMWRTHTSYAAGPQHQRFLISAGLTLVFAYLSISAFWRARRK